MSNIPSPTTAVAHLPVASRPHAVLWAPVVLLTGWLCAMAIGLGSGGAIAASSSTAIDVTGTVDAAVQMNTSGCTSTTSLSFVSGLVPGDNWTWTGDTCTIDFGSNNDPAGATLQVFESPTAGAGPAMKCVSTTCAGDSISDVSPDTAPSGPGSNFGIILWAAGPGTTSLWSAGSGSHVGYPVADTPATACQTASASVSMGSCGFRFGGQAAIGVDKPGSYQAEVSFVTMAN